MPSASLAHIFLAGTLLLPGRTYLLGRQHAGTDEWGLRWPHSTGVNARGGVHKGRLIQAHLLLCVQLALSRDTRPQRAAMTTQLGRSRCEHRLEHGESSFSNMTICSGQHCPPRQPPGSATTPCKTKNYQKVPVTF